MLKCRYSDSASLVQGASSGPPAYRVYRIDRLITSSAREEADKTTTFPRPCQGSDKNGFSRATGCCPGARHRFMGTPVSPGEGRWRRPEDSPSSLIAQRLPCVYRCVNRRFLHRVRGRGGGTFEEFCVFPARRDRSSSAVGKFGSRTIVPAVVHLQISRLRELFPPETMAGSGTGNTLSSPPLFSF